MNRMKKAPKDLEAVAGADNPHSLIAIFGRGNLAIKERWSPLEVGLHLHMNCTEEFPVLENGKGVFVDPKIYVIKAATFSVHYSTTTWHTLGSSYPELREVMSPD
jgi:hypothetical protein